MKRAQFTIDDGSYIWTPHDNADLATVARLFGEAQTWQEFSDSLVLAGVNPMRDPDQPKPPLMYGD